MARNKADILNGEARTEKDFKPEYKLEELLAGIAPENRHEEIDCGLEVGREIVEW